MVAMIVKQELQTNTHHRKNGENNRLAKTKASRAAIEKGTGVRYCILNELQYFDCEISCHWSYAQSLTWHSKACHELVDRERNDIQQAIWRDSEVSWLFLRSKWYWLNTVQDILWILIFQGWSLAKLDCNLFSSSTEGYPSSWTLWTLSLCRHAIYSALGQSRDVDRQTSSLIFAVSFNISMVEGTQQWTCICTVIWQVQYLTMDLCMLIGFNGILGGIPTIALLKLS